MPYDNPIPGYNNNYCNTLRWESSTTTLLSYCNSTTFNQCATRWLELVALKLLEKHLYLEAREVC